MLENVTAVILAGGKGTRLEPVVDDRPKPMALVAGKPFLDYLLDMICRADIRRVVLCTGYRASDIQRHYGNTYKSLKIVYSQERVPLGTGGAVRNALGVCRSDFLLVFNGDSYLDIDIVDFFRWFRAGDGEGAMALAKVEERERYGSVVIDEDAKITSFLEKNESEPDGFINAGIYVLSSKVVQNLPAESVSSLEHDLFPFMVDEGLLYGYKSVDSFIDIGTTESYHKAQIFFPKLR